MTWIKQECEGVHTGYTCSNCGVLWLTVEPDRPTPTQCEACGEKADRKDDET